MPIFVLFVSAGVLFDGAFSLWVSLTKKIIERIIERAEVKFNVIGKNQETT